MSTRREKILIRGVNWLGDAVMTTPALQRLREARPQALIELLTHEKLADLWRGHPSIDGVVTFTARQPLLAVARALRSRNFDTAMVFPNSTRSAIEVFLARIPRRIGYAGNFRSVFLTRAFPPRIGAVKMHKRSAAEVSRRIARGAVRDTFPPSAHHMHDYLNLVAELGGNPAALPPLLRVTAEEAAAARQRLGFPAGLVLALNPGAEYGPAKRWPAERFLEAAVQVHAAVPCHWVVLGGKGDRDVAGQLAIALSTRVGSGRVVNLAGETSLRELCAVLKASSLLLTNDSGPMHVAAAVGTPVIVPFGSTSPELTGPLLSAGARHHIALGEAPCAPCFRRECPVDFRCMQSIPAERMAKAALSCLGRPS
jgi:heptosyltransferase II